MRTSILGLGMMLTGSAYAKYNPPEAKTTFTLVEYFDEIARDFLWKCEAKEIVPCDNGRDTEKVIQIWKAEAREELMTFCKLSGNSGN